MSEELKLDGVLDEIKHDPNWFNPKKVVGVWVTAKDRQEGSEDE